MQSWGPLDGAPKTSLPEDSLDSGSPTVPNQATRKSRARDDSWPKRESPEPGTVHGRSGKVPSQGRFQENPGAGLVMGATRPSSRLREPQGRAPGPSTRMDLGSEGF
jgi:hypothetical protein